MVWKHRVKALLFNPEFVFFASIQIWLRNPDPKIKIVHLWVQNKVCYC